MSEQKDTINKKLNLQEKSLARRRERFLTFLCSPPPLVLAAEADPKAAASLHAAATYPPRCGLRNPENPSMSRCTDRTALLSRRDGPEEVEEEDAEAATSGRERSSSCHDTNGGSRDTACGPIALKREEKLSLQFGTKKIERLIIRTWKSSGTQKRTEASTLGLSREARNFLDDSLAQTTLNSPG